jgi:hypothetical protein
MGIPAKNVDMYFGELVSQGFAEIDRKHQLTEKGQQLVNRTRSYDAEDGEGAKAREGTEE